MEKLVKFKELGLTEQTLDALKKKGFEEPSPIQALIIPALLQGTEDIVGQAQTGTGKTAAFGLPMIEMLEPSRISSNKIQALVLVPTRELAVQVSAEINSLKGSKNLKIMPIYGGQSMEEQLRKLRHGIDIVVGTPGRVQDHLRRQTIDLSAVHFMVLDEADEMLNMGFVDEIEAILKLANPEKRLLLFSATMPERIRILAKKFMGKYKEISVKNTNSDLTTSLTEQIYFEVRSSDRFEALCRIVDVTENFYGLVFCRTRVDVDQLTSQLLDRGYEVAGLHGDISQGQREKVLAQFKKKNLNILVATDVASRGIDVNNLSHVINYSLPQSPEDYVHRIGRTGRAGKEGTAITFITPNEYRKLILIKKVSGTDIKKGKIPAVADIIKIKQTRLKDELEKIIQGEDFKEHLALAQELLLKGDAPNIVAALLKQNFAGTLDPDNYNEISAVNPDYQGTTRIEIAMGREAGMTPHKLVQFLTDKTGVAESKIKEVQVFGTSSLITVPFAEAEIIMKEFQESVVEGKPLIKKTAARSGGSSSRRESSYQSGGGRDYARKSGNSYGRDRSSSPRSGNSYGSGDRPRTGSYGADRPARTAGSSSESSERSYKPRTTERTPSSRAPRTDKSGEPYKPRKISNESAPRVESTDGPFKKFERKAGVRKQDGMPERKPRKKD